MAYKISIGNGFPGDGELKFSLSPREWGEDLQRELQEAGVQVGPIVEHGDLAHEILVLGVGFAGAGGIKQLAALLHTFVRRHDGKEFTIHNQVGDEISTAGYGVDDLEKLLNAQAVKQLAADESWQLLQKPPN